MNIFVLDKDPTRAANLHCNKHVVKMVLESGSMLCTAHWIGWQRMLNPPKMKTREMQAWLFDNVHKDLQPPWKMTHVNHPCTQWTQRAWGNYMWLSRHGLALCAEYTRRYGREHKSLEVHRWLNRHIPPTFESSTEICTDQTPFALAMPEECKVPGDTVASYRNYYCTHKRHIAKWPAGLEPSWWSNP